MHFIQNPGVLSSCHAASMLSHLLKPYFLSTEHEEVGQRTFDLLTFGALPSNQLPNVPPLPLKKSFVTHQNQTVTS
jgi:hypothetical protein